MDDDLAQRLLLAESDFLTALQNGPQMLGSFRQTLSALPNTLSTATKTGGAGNDTLSLAHSVASRIMNIASCYLHVKDEEENFSARLRVDCDTMLHQMDALKLNGHFLRSDSCSHLHPPPRRSTPVSDTTISPPFLIPAYQWLLTNIHNPYPTAEVKTRIATSSSCQISSINSWFINARRRIGWTTLCRDHFANCRADMLDAAYRALVEEDPQRVLPAELRHSFIAMKVAAEDIYSSTFTRSAFVEDLDAVVKDTTDGHKEPVEVGQCGAAKQANPGEMAQHSYPSPDRSLAASPVPALDHSSTDESEEEEDVAPPIIAGSKRRRSFIEPENQLPLTARRPIKRLRTSTTSQTQLPSPPSSTDGIELPSDLGSPRLSSDTQSETNKALPSRKQCVSDIDNSGVPKLPGGLTAVPPLHTVSDPLPCRNIGNESIDDWFNTNFDSLFTIPPPVDATEPDFSTSWEVELFKDYCIPENPKYAPQWPPLVTDTDVSAATHLSEFDNLLQSIASDTYVAPSDSMFPSNISGAPHTGFLGPSIPDISHIDWTSLLNGSDAYQSTIDSTFSQYPTVFQPLPDMDLSMLQLPPLIPTAQSHGDLASKRAKLDQFHAMQEAVRRMEQELQLEGVIL